MANSNAKVQLKTFDNGYALVVNGEESEPVAYGEPMEMETTDGKRFMAFIEAQGESDIEAVTEFWAYEVLPITDVPILEDEGEDEGEGDEDEGEEDDEDEDENEEVEVNSTTK